MKFSDIAFGLAFAVMVVMAAVYPVIVIGVLKMLFWVAGSTADPGPTAAVSIAIGWVGAFVCALNFYNWLVKR